MTEVRLSQRPHARRHRRWGTIPFHGIAFAERRDDGDGELNAGAFGEGYVDRRHPHTTTHELIVSGVDLLGTADGRGRLGLVVGKGFVAFGTDDPMSRPFFKYPVNHHLAQVLERAVAIAQYDVGWATAEATLFNGDEPESPGQLPVIRRSDGQWRFGDSWSTRLTVRPVAGLEVQGSYGDVHSPEHRDGAGGDAKKLSISGRWHDAGLGRALCNGRMGATPASSAILPFSYGAGRGDGARGRFRGYRFESTSAPKRNDGRSLPYPASHPRNEILGTRAGRCIQCVSDTRRSNGPMGRGVTLSSSPPEVAKADEGVFDVVSTYGSNRAGTLSVGVQVGWRNRGHRMGRYGVLNGPGPGMPAHAH